MIHLLSATLLLAACIVGLAQDAATIARAEPASAKTVVLAINDVYRIEGIDAGRIGGMARVRALRQSLEREAPDLLFLHAGDFLSPSFLGRTYRGAQMIDLMNIMDGDPRGGSLDARMFVTFGNHEFDDTHCTKHGPLGELVATSEFTWLASNLHFSKCEPLRLLQDDPKVSRGRIVESGGLRVGLFGLTLSRKRYRDIVRDPLATGCAETKALRAQGADVVIALTHLPWRDDLALLGLGPDSKPLPPAAQDCDVVPNLVVGGHDHASMMLPSERPRLFKADADAASAWVIEIEKTSTAQLRIDSRLIRLDESQPVDPLAARIAAMWRVRHDERFCLETCIGEAEAARKHCLLNAENGKCLTETIARTASEIETEEIANRSFETGFGNWVADQMRAAAGADVAFFNSGALRLNYTLPAGSEITRRHLEQMFPFKNKIIVRDIPARVLWRVMQKAVARRGTGGWIHFSGMAVRLDVENGRRVLKEALIRRGADDILALGPDSDEQIRIASLSFVLANGDGHGFTLCSAEQDVWSCKRALEEDTRWPLEGDASDLAGFVRQRLLALSGDLILAKDGRLCEARTTDCLIDRWER